jgi:hypothetical protein
MSPWLRQAGRELNRRVRDVVYPANTQLQSEEAMFSTARTTTAAVIAAATTAALSGGLFLAPSSEARQGRHQEKPVHVEVFAPEAAANAGIAGTGWFVDMEVDFKNRNLAQTGFNGLQLTGPAGHNNIPPAAGLFGTGHDDKMPGLVVLTTTTSATLPGFSGPGTNLAGLFNLTGVTNRTPEETELWDTWMVGAPVAGSGVDTVLTVAVIKDLNHDGIYNDAPDLVTDANGDGRINFRDLKALGVASNIVRVPFHISADPA